MNGKKEERYLVHFNNERESFSMCFIKDAARCVRGIIIGISNFALRIKAATHAFPNALPYFTAQYVF